MSATAIFIGNQALVAQVLNLPVTAVALGGTIAVTINTKVVSYTCVSGETLASAAANLAALLAACQFPEFLESTWAQSTTTANIVTVTANTPGTPIYSTRGWGVSVSATGGAAISLVQVQPNLSPSDIADPLNWLRNGVNALPQNGDNFIISNTDVPLLWNLDQFPVPGSFTRWQDFTGTIGLPENNPSGYVEYRPTYLSCVGQTSSSSSSSPSNQIVAIIGQGTIGSGPTRERYNFGSNPVKWVVNAAGSPEDDYAVRILGTNAATTLQVTGVTVGVGMLPGESAAFATAVVDGSGALDVGQNVTVGQSVSLFGATLNLYCACPVVSAQQSAQVTVLSTQLAYPSFTMMTGSTLVWNSDSNVTVLALQNGSTMDCSQDVRPFTIGTLTIDADTCQVNDPNNRTQWTNAVVLNQQVTSGPFVFGSGRAIKVVV
jgi:hypothetical protein